ncbi:MAG: adenylate/guanylate cyclase domain-containing protein [Solirubrobacterales bacterium]
MQIPKTNYLEHDGVSIAWQVFGEGPAEILFVPGWVSNVDLFWQYPQSRAFFSELSGFARVAVYDKPGTGASDPVEETPSLELRVEQLAAVMDAAELERATVIGVSEGGVPACLAAAARPDRVGRLVMLNGSAAAFDRRAKGLTSDAAFEEWVEFMRRTAEHWGEGYGGDRWLVGVPDADVAWGMLQRACATRAVARGYFAMMEAGMSAWDVLAAIHQPVLALQRTDDPIVPVELARAAVARMPNARLVELAGAEHLPWLGDTTEMLEHLRAFVGAPPPLARAERVLATILFTDIVGSTEHLTRLGDAGWRARLDRHSELVEDRLERFEGHLVATTGDGTLATFGGPARAVAAARGILDALAAEGMNARAGVHVGEIELRGEDIAGIAVHVAARVMAEANSDEVLVSRTVRDLTAGSGLEFTDRGTHTLKGVPEDWQLYALA